MAATGPTPALVAVLSPHPVRGVALLGLAVAGTCAGRAVPRRSFLLCPLCLQLLLLVGQPRESAEQLCWLAFPCAPSSTEHSLSPPSWLTPAPLGLAGTVAGGPLSNGQRQANSLLWHQGQGHPLRRWPHVGAVAAGQQRQGNGPEPGWGGCRVALSGGGEVGPSKRRDLDKATVRIEACAMGRCPCGVILLTQA